MALSNRERQKRWRDRQRRRRSVLPVETTLERLAEALIIVHLLDQDDPSPEALSVAVSEFLAIWSSSVFAAVGGNYP